MEYLGFLIIVLFVIPVFTGKIINAGNLTGIIFGMLVILAKNMEFLRLPLLVFFLYCALILVLIVSKGKEEIVESKTAVILGCSVNDDGKPCKMLEDRLKAGLRYLNTNHESVILCGGKGDDEVISEAECMYTWLKEHGLDEDRMIRENQSTTTFENLKFAKEIMIEKNMETDVVIITNRFHEYRACTMAKQLGYSCTPYPSKTSWWLAPTYYLREVIAITYEKIRGVF